MRFTKYIMESNEIVKDWLSYIKKDKELYQAVEVLKKLNKGSITHS